MTDEEYYNRLVVGQSRTAEKAKDVRSRWRKRKLQNWPKKLFQKYIVPVCNYLVGTKPTKKRRSPLRIKLRRLRYRFNQQAENAANSVSALLNLRSFIIAGVSVTTAILIVWGVKSLYNEITFHHSPVFLTNSTGAKAIIASDAWNRIDSPLKQRVIDAFPGDTIMWSIAACESQFRQFKEDSSSIVVNDGHYGLFQIDTSHSHDGNDIKTIAGNIAEAKLLRQKNGYRDWQSDSRSEHCWNKALGLSIQQVASGPASSQSSVVTTVSKDLVVKDTTLGLQVGDTTLSAIVSTQLEGRRLRLEWKNVGKQAPFLAKCKRLQDGTIVEYKQIVGQDRPENRIPDYPDWCQFRGDSIIMNVQWVKVN